MAKTDSELFVWDQEHGASYDVPGIILHLVRKGILTDESWHNDVCPRFELVGRKKKGPNGLDEYGVTLWVEHPYRTFREGGDEAKRFMATEGYLSSDTDQELETNDLKDALLFVFKRIGKYVPKYRGRNPEELLDELAAEVGGAYVGG